jgi:hypothetical protein
MKTPAAVRATMRPMLYTIGFSSLLCLLAFATQPIGSRRAPLNGVVLAQTTAAPKNAAPAPIQIAAVPVPARVVVQSPAETDTDLQIICLFQSDPSNTLRGSLTEANNKLNGLLDRIRKPDLFAGALGETILIRRAEACAPNSC